MSVFQSRIEALIERDGRKGVADYYDVSTSTIDRWRRGGNPKNEADRTSILNRGKRLTGRSITVRDTETGRFEYVQFEKEETDLIIDSFESTIIDKREKGLFTEVFKRTGERLENAVDEAVTEGQKERAQTRLDDFVEVREGQLKKLAQLYRTAKDSNNLDDWRDYRNAYSTITGKVLRKQDQEELGVEVGNYSI